MQKFLFAPFFMLCAIFLLACPGDKDGNSGGGGGLAPGETRIDFTLSGGNLSETVRIQGVTTKPSFYVYSDISVLAMGIEGVQSADGVLALNNMTMSAPPEVGPFEPKRSNYDIVISGFRNAEGELRNYSLRPNEGDATMTVHQVDDQRVRISFEGKASPTQLGAKDLVFDFSGEVEHRFD